MSGKIRLLKPIQINRADTKRMLTAGGLVFSDIISQEAPHELGTLRRSIHVGGITGSSGVDDDGNPYSDIGGLAVSANRGVARIGTNLIYAWVQEFGMDIYPNTAPFMTFYWKKIGEVVRARKVSIPATGFMLTGFNKSCKPAVLAMIKSLKNKFR